MKEKTIYLEAKELPNFVNDYYVGGGVMLCLGAVTEIVFGQRYNFRNLPKKYEIIKLSICDESQEGFMESVMTDLDNIEINGKFYHLLCPTISFIRKFLFPFRPWKSIVGVKFYWRIEKTNS